MNNTFDNIAILVKQLQDLPMSDKDQRRLDEKFRLEFSYNSNHIEGNTLTYQDTKVLLLKDIVPVGEIYTMRELEEMKAHDAAFRFINEWALDTDRELNETTIKEINKLILVKDFWKDAQTYDGSPSRKNIKVGEYKSTPNSVLLSNGEIFHYAEPIEVPAKMHDLLDWYNDEKSSLHPITLAAVFHHKFVLIHPFDDGNGRISRLIVNYILLKNGLPPIVIKSSEKQKYLNALRLADAGNMEVFIDFIAEQVMWSLELSLKAAKGVSIDELGDLDKKLEKFKKEKISGAATNGKYRSERIEELVKKDLSFLLEKLETMFTKFDDFYNERSVQIRLDEAVYNTLSASEFSNFYSEYTNFKFEEDRIEIDRANIFAIYGSPINEILTNTIVSKRIKIKFNVNRIELIIEGLNPYYFTYDDAISKESMDEIVELIGNDLYDQMNGDKGK